MIGYNLITKGVSDGSFVSRGFSDVMICGVGLGRIDYVYDNLSCKLIFCLPRLFFKATLHRSANLSFVAQEYIALMQLSS